MRIKVNVGNNWVGPPGARRLTPEHWVECEVEVTIDTQGITQYFGTRAMESKSGRSRGLRGLISAKRISPKQLPSDPGV